MRMVAGEQELDDWLAFALDAAYQAGRLTLGYFLRGIEVERKEDQSPVTVADRAAEETLRQMIHARFPADGIIGEEYGDQAGTSGRSWVIDPIDGTKSFLSGVPLYANLVALIDDTTRESLVGVAHFPALNETLYARRGGGAFWNGRRARVSKKTALAQSVALTSDFNMWDGREESWRRIVAATYFQRTWGDAYGYLLVATGRAELTVDPYMYLWDAAPFGVILPEAGGTFTDWKGTATIDGGEAFATNGVLFDEVLRLIKG